MKRYHFVALFVLLSLLLSTGPAVKLSASRTAVAPPAESPEEALAEEAINLPAQMMFIENMGQFDERVRFQVRSGSGALWLTEGALWITVIEQTNEGAAEREREVPLHLRAPAPEPRRGVNLKLRFPGANPRPRLEPFDRLNTRVSYFIGDNPAQWHADVPVWGGVRYVDLYPGVDLEVTSERGLWAWRFAIRDSQFPTSDARLLVEGAEALALDGADRLQITTGLGNFALPLWSAVTADGTPLDLPTVEPAINGTEITAPFFPSPSLSGSVSPQGAAGLTYATFLGGSDWDEGRGIALDESGAAYVTGWTWSSDFPTTPGDYDTDYNGNWDVFVGKLSPDGSSLYYATFLGGGDSDFGYDIALDESGAAYVTGETLSSDFPTTPGAYDTGYNGGDFFIGDAFVGKLSPDGSSLYYATFLGGSSGDSGRAIALDGSGAAYVTGRTWSSDFPTTPGDYDTTYNGGEEAFVGKLSPDGGSLYYATFIGGGIDDSGSAIVLDASGAAYVTGATNSSDFPTIPGSYDTDYNGGYNDAFASKLSPDGGSLYYSTFLGGSGSDSGSAIALDGSGATYVTGATDSSNFPTTPGAYDTTYNGGDEAFVGKLASDGGSLSYSTFLGGSSSDSGEAIAVDGTGAAYVAGWTGSSNFPTTSGAYDTDYNGGYSDAFLSKLASDGGSLSYSTFLGGSGSDLSFAIEMDEDEMAYVTGATNSSDFPTTPGAYDTSYNGGDRDVFVVKLPMGLETTIDIQQIEDFRIVDRSLTDGGENITFRFKAHNYGSGSVTLQRTGFSGHKPNGDYYDKFNQNVTVGAGQDYVFEETILLDGQPGTFTAKTTWQDADGHWHDIPKSDPSIQDSISFGVANIQQTEDLRITNRSPASGGQNITFWFKVHNYGGRSVTFRRIGFSGHKPNGDYYDRFNQNVTVASGGDYTFDETIFLEERSGTFTAKTTYQDLNGGWHDIPKASPGIRDSISFSMMGYSPSGFLYLNTMPTYVLPDPLTCLVQVYNPNAWDITYTVYLQLPQEGDTPEMLLIHTLPVPAGSTAEYTFDFGIQEPGTYRLVGELWAEGMLLLTVPDTVEVVPSLAHKAAMDASWRFTRAALHEFQQAQDIVVDAYEDSVPNLPAQAINFIVGEVVGLITPVGYAALVPYSEIWKAEYKISAKLLALEEVIHALHRPEVERWAIGQIDAYLTTERQKVEDREDQFDKYVLTKDFDRWSIEMENVTRSSLDVLQTRVESKRFWGLSTPPLFIGRTTLWDEQTTFIIYKTLGGLLGWLGILAAVAVMIFAIWGTFGWTIPALVASLAGLKPLVLGASRFATAILLVLCALVMDFHTEHIVAPAITHDHDQGLDALEYLISGASGVSLSDIETRVSTTGKQISLVSTLTNSHTQPANPLFQTSLYSADGRLIDVLTQQLHVGAQETTTLQNQLHMPPGRYRMVTALHTSNHLGVTSEVTTLEIARPQVDLALHIAQPQLALSQTLQASVDITNTDVSTSTGDLGLLIASSDGENLKVEQFSLAAGASHHADFRFVPPAEGSYVLQAVVIGEEGNELAFQEAGYVVGSGPALAVNVGYRPEYGSGVDVSTFITATNAGNQATSSTLTLVTMDWESTQPVYTRTLPLDLVPGAAHNQQVTVLPNAQPGRYYVNLLLDDVLHRTLFFLVAAEDTLWVTVSASPSSVEPGQSVTLTAQVMNTTYTDTNALVTATVINPALAEHILTMSQVTTGTYQGVDTPILSGTYEVNISAQKFNWRGSEAQATFSAGQPSWLQPAIEGSPRAGQTKPITVTVHNEQALPIPGASVILSGTNELLYRETDASGIAVLWVTPPGIEPYQVTVQKLGYARTTTIVEVEAFELYLPLILKNY